MSRRTTKRLIHIIMKKIYYHILEYGDYDKIGYQGYYLTIEEAENEVNRLSGYFPDSSFQIWQDTSKNEPPITTE